MEENETEGSEKGAGQGAIKEREINQRNRISSNCK